MPPQFQCDTVISDYEPAFGKDVIIDDQGRYIIDPADRSNRNIAIAQIYCNNRIKHVSYNIKRNAEHSKLAPVDRLARTLRDMIFNAKRENPAFTLTPETLRKLCDIYNRSPHETLSRVMGFSTYPLAVYKNKTLQDEICLRLLAQNYHTAHRIQQEHIDNGSEVWLHNPRVFGKKRRNTVEDKPYRVVANRGMAGYTIADADGHTRNITRKDFVFKQ